ncbi:MAG TPA: hypothetical protein PK165_01870 [bacterium]|nr:hypothetical protein [bacterium]HOL49148.1 hypothetical protein [bacterium]HPO51563.1 hypothetical protein [bacterium]HXK44353.1 hypothetical protein [bacterium]
MEISAGGKATTGCFCFDCVRNNPEIKTAFETFKIRHKTISYKQKNCPFCGMTLEDWKQSGFAGCATCYQIFRTHIKREIKKCQHGSLHRGKFPHSENVSKNFLVYFENEMRRAVAGRDIEKVKKIKQEIEMFIKNG